MELLKSRKFWIMIGDAVISTLTIVLSWSLAPSRVNEVVTLVALWQPIVITVVISIAAQNVAGIKAGAIVQAQVAAQPDPVDQAE